MSTSTVESVSKQRTMEQNLPQPEDESSSARLGELAAFRAKHQSKHFANKDFTQKSEEHKDKKRAEKKLIAGVLVRYWNQKEKQLQGHTDDTILPDDNALAKPRSHDRDYKWTAKTSLGDLRGRATLLQTQPRQQYSNLSVPLAFEDSHDYVDYFATPQSSPQDHAYKVPVEKGLETSGEDDDASVIPKSADERGYKQPERSLHAHGVLLRDGPSPHNDPSSRRNESTNALRGSVATSPMTLERHKVDAHPSASIAPCDPDVLFGRRQAQRNHPGNVRLRELCHRFHHDYRNGDRGNKTAITWRIVHTIQQDGGRFLKFDEEGWAEVSKDMAREKVAFTIRDTFHQVSTREA